MFQGSVYCFATLEEALLDVDMVIEAIAEELEAKQSLMESELK